MTVLEGLEGLNLDMTTHVVVRQKGKNEDFFLGGGTVDSVCSRFGYLNIASAYIADFNVFVIYVV